MTELTLRLESSIFGSSSYLICLLPMDVVLSVTIHHTIGMYIYILCLVHKWALGNYAATGSGIPKDVPCLLQVGSFLALFFPLVQSNSISFSL